jgi:hypothetical protein
MLVTLPQDLLRSLLLCLLRMHWHRSMLIFLRRNKSIRRTVSYQDTQIVIISTDMNGRSIPIRYAGIQKRYTLILIWSKAVRSQSPTILRPCKTLSTHLLASDIKTSSEGREMPVSTCCSKLLSVVHSSESNERFRRYC